MITLDTKILVFTPTCRFGGLDVYEASLKRQNYDKFGVFVVDELLFGRTFEWFDVFHKISANYEDTISFVPKQENKKRNLCESYNLAAQFAVDNNFDLFVSLQDYIWVDTNGLTRFAYLNEKYPNNIYTGVTHISRDPFPTKVVDPQGLYTIFKEPFYDMPKRLSWEDVRVKEIYKTNGNILVDIEPGHWEANWAAVPVSLLKEGLRWNEDYDYGVAYENMDFAQRANRDFGAKVVFDSGNVAISLPHKDYFDGEREEIIEYSNKERYDRDWPQ